MKQLLLQAFNLIRQNPFYATISIIGTAVTIAFVMVVVMIYDFRTMDMAPESDRSDMMYTGSGMTYRKLDHTNQNSGMGRKAFEAADGHPEPAAPGICVPQLPAVSR